MSDEIPNKKPTTGPLGDYLAALEELIGEHKRLHQDFIEHISVLRHTVGTLVSIVLEENRISKEEFVARATASCDDERVAHLLAVWTNGDDSDKRFDA